MAMFQKSGQPSAEAKPVAAKKKITENVRVCENCGESFAPPHYICELTGTNHQVPTKTYYGPNDGLMVMWKTDRTIQSTDGSGLVKKIAGRNAQFIKGIYRTADPEEQDFFDNYKNLITVEQWETMHISQEEQLRRQREQLSHQQRLIVEQNEELARLRAKMETT